MSSVMRRLGFRLAINLAATTLIGLSILDVAFLIFAQSMTHRRRLLDAELAAREVGIAAVTAGDGEALQALAERVADARHVVITFVTRHGDGQDTVRWSTRAIELPDTFTSGVPVVHAGHRHVAYDVPGGQGVRAVASISLESVVAGALEWQGEALLVLLAVAALMVLLGLWFMRRTAVAPIERMTAALNDADVGGLGALEHTAGPSDDLVRLGRAIGRVAERLQADRERMAEQLDALGVAHGQLERTRDQLVRSERLAVVGKLAAGLAHEIGNPLAIVTGYADILRESSEAFDDESRDLVVRMRRELERIQQTVRGLLDFSRAEDGATGRGDVGQAMTHLLQLLEPQERMRAVELTTDVPDDLTPVVIGTEALVQVLVNLCFNAADALDGTGQVRVRARKERDGVAITVDDDGPGLPENLRDRIFEPFFTTKPAGQGTGLGLSVCERIVTAVGGEVSAGTSELGGTRFTIWVPAAPER